MRAFSSLFLLMFAANLQAATKIAEIQAAKPLERVEPKYPMKSAYRDKEGWVQLSFVVDKTGKVVDPIVTDSSGVRDFEKAAIKAVKKWTYSPALENGEPVQQCETKLQLDFKLSTPQLAVTRKFLKVYKQAYAALKQGDYNTAAEHLKFLKSRRIGNMYEDAWYWMLNADLMAARGTKSDELKSLRRATVANTHEYLGEDNYLYTMHKKFVLEVQMGYWQEALSTFEKIQQLPNGEATANKLSQYAQQVKGVLDGDQSLEISGTIDDNGNWSHRLTRSHFGLNNIEGDLQNLDIRCKHRRNIYTVDQQSVWSLPTGWDKCWVHVKGEPGSTFELLEIAKINKGEAE